MGKDEMSGKKKKNGEIFTWVKTTSKILEREGKKGKPMDGLYIKGRNVGSYLKSYRSEG